MRLSVLAALFALVFALALGAANAEDAVLYKNPDCGCCGEYAKVLEGEGFRVRVKETTALDALRRMAGVPDKLASCHTMTVGNYVVEGHVPLSAIQKLLAEKPDIRGSRSRACPRARPA